MPDLFPERIETERLAFGPTHQADVHRMYEVCGKDDGIEAVTQYMPWDPHETPKETAEFLETQAEHWEEGDSAGYVLRPREGEDGAGEIAGTTALHTDWDKQLGTIGLWLRKPFWGRGYSGERAARLLELAFDRLDLDLVTVSHDPENDPSRRAIEKYVERFGGRKVGRVRNDIVIDGQPRDSIRYSISCEEWERNAVSPDGGERAGGRTADSAVPPESSRGSFLPDAI
jgi:ribosomal-protein-alanine N-acetyltransferase